MSYYILPPPQNVGMGNAPYAFWNNAFTKEELDAIERYCDKLTLDKAIIDGHKKEDDYSKIRRSKTAWISNDGGAVTALLYDRMAWVTSQMNGRWYDFDLSCFWEDFQFTVYEGDMEAHYDWHIDEGTNTQKPRKFSMSLLLSDPESYEGGDLQFLTGQSPVNAEKSRGTVIGFPSFRLHRVTPVTKGIRKSIVVWVSGPKFR